MDELTVERLKLLKPQLTMFPGVKGEDGTEFTFQNFYDIEAAIEFAVENYKKQSETKEITPERKSKTETIHMLYLTDGIGSEQESKLIYIGTYEFAQDLMDELEAAANGRYLDFTLEETVSINGVVICNKAVDI